MTNSYAPIGYFYDKKGNLRLYHMEGKGKAHTLPVAMIIQHLESLKRMARLAGMR